MMEPHATLAAWDGDRVTIWTANQMIDWTAGDLAKTLGIAKEKVRVVSPLTSAEASARSSGCVRMRCSQRSARERPAVP